MKDVITLNYKMRFLNLLLYADIFEGRRASCKKDCPIRLLASRIIFREDIALAKLAAVTRGKGLPGDKFSGSSKSSSRAESVASMASQSINMGVF